MNIRKLVGPTTWSLLSPLLMFGAFACSSEHATQSSAMDSGDAASFVSTGAVFADAAKPQNTPAEDAAAVQATPPQVAMPDASLNSSNTIDATVPSDAGPDASAIVDAGPQCNGNIRYELNRSTTPTSEEQAAYDLIAEAMDAALSYYNCYANFDKALQVSYEPSVATADGNPNGSIRFGSMESMNYITAMHEISHTLGIGDNNWDAMIVNGIFPGIQATEQLRAITGIPDDVVHGDNQHFWPYGLNYTSEVMSEQDLINHCLMVTAICQDLGY